MAAPKPTTLSAWKAAAKRRIELPSGLVVVVRLPSMMEMLASGDLPNDLRAIAINGIDDGEELTPQQLESFHEFSKVMVAKTLVEPQITADDTVELPQEDFDTLLALAQRRASLEDVAE